MPGPDSSFTERSQAHEYWYLTGATASGKSAIALKLAERLNAEIVSMDSMSIYRGMDIGTAKPSVEHQASIAHHLIDIRSPDESYSVSDFRQDAISVSEEIESRGRRVLFVGGTPLYLKSMLRGIFDGPPADWAFRRQIEEEIEKSGLEPLQTRLQQIDPLTAHKLHANDKRRMIRALEVYTLTGQPISHLQMEFEDGREADECRVFALHWPRELLHRRIEDRVDQMFAAGLIDEVAGLLSQYGELSHTALQAVGYREVIEYLGKSVDQQTTIEAVKTRTRQFARRQETWFRGLSECRWIEMAPELTADSIADLICDRGSSSSKSESQ